AGDGVNVRRVRVAKSRSSKLFSICSVIAVIVFLNVVPFRGGSSCLGSGSRRPPARQAPLPAADVRQVVAMLGNVLFVLDQLLMNRLPKVGGPRTKLRQPVDHVFHEVKSVQVIEYDHVERRRGRSLLLVAAHMEVRMIGAVIRQPVNERWIPMERKDHG